MFYCSPVPIEFHLPTPEPGSGIYGHMLSTFYEHELDLAWEIDQSLVITDEHNKLDELQWQSALTHWYLMRTMLEIDFWLL
jgi:8-oxo-dGTP pyrophosphatase MutT (NUDIX family)